MKIGKLYYAYDVSDEPLKFIGMDEDLDPIFTTERTECSNWSGGSVPGEVRFFKNTPFFRYTKPKNKIK